MRGAANPYLYEWIIGWDPHTRPPLPIGRHSSVVPLVALMEEDPNAREPRSPAQDIDGRRLGEVAPPALCLRPARKDDKAVSPPAYFAGNSKQRPVTAPRTRSATRDRSSAR
jgi:hypothetical protein